MTTDPSLCDDFKNLFTKKLNILPTTNENKLNTLPISNENTDSIKKEVVDDKNNDVKISCVNNNNDKSYQTRLNLAKSIKKLEKYEHTQIYQIIKNEGEKFSKNRRGIFFDLLKFKQSTIDNLNKYILSTDAFRKKKQSLN
tara:strand:+ start:1196 stop:1618 length:423 start_codon:yes stop_codon:yes gene_type:complete